MTETLSGNDDQAIQILVLQPGVNRLTDAHLGEITDLVSAQVSFTWRGDPGTLTITTYKDSPSVAKLNGDVELQVMLRDPRREIDHQWRQVVNARFVVDLDSEDRADEANTITFTCPNSATLLNKTKIHRSTGAARLNNDYDRAKSDYQEAQREYERPLKAFGEQARALQRLHRFPRVGTYAYFGVAWLNRSREIRRGALASNAARNGKLYWWNGGKWRALSDARWPVMKSELRELGVEVARNRRRMDAARRRYQRAERAQRETSRDGVRRFYNATPGRALSELWIEEVRRQRDEYQVTMHHDAMNLLGVRRSWTNTHDSNGQWWPLSTRSDFEVPLGGGLLDAILDLEERGKLDWQMRGRTLDLTRPRKLEVDQSTRVNLLLGRPITEAPDRGSRMEHFSVACVVGGDGYSRMIPYNVPVETAWGRFVGTIREPESVDVASARDLTYAARRAGSARFRRESTLSLTIGQADPIPMIDFQPGHWIGVWDHEGERTRRQVDSIVLSWAPDAPMTAVVTLDTRFRRREISFAKTMSKTLGGVDHMQGHIPLNPALEPPVRFDVPGFAPPIVEIQSTVQFDPLEGRPWIALSALWEDVGIPEPTDPTVDEDELLDETPDDPDGID
ncbi:hypothetical protein [Nesterenkonia sandarakina]|uniref:Uncharacterized protein n=1 Tax=Nesterenkonia sandarakina TaxID=272918 RepID=A0A2T0YJC1_9MICC|nr:hypothetical protein [Nesterenkonia sandarakina]PRZ15139.1 hypothetical protein BCL67_10960 [Nesterenkonia sandarakina]